MRIVLFVLAAVAPQVGCGDSRCRKAVHHVVELTTHAGARKASLPGKDEQEVIDQIERTSIGSCEQEGLSQEQLDCILAMRGFEDMKAIGTCPAIAAKHPSWLLAP